MKEDETQKNKSTDAPKMKTFTQAEGLDYNSLGHRPRWIG